MSKNLSQFSRNIARSNESMPPSSSLHSPAHPFEKLSLSMIVQLAAPHTWPAAALPTLIAICLAVSFQHVLSVSLACALLVIVILMQSAVNTLNDYFDYIKGADSIDNQLDPSDAVLVYNNIDPKSALCLAIGFLASAFIIGGYVIWCAGPLPLVIGIIGAVILVLYSGGKTPISYLPIGELVSGFTMGSLIMLASYQALTGILEWRILLFSFPLFCGIGLILLTNNTCDIEKDKEAKRRTLAILLGRKRAIMVYHIVLCVQIISIVFLIGSFLPKGLIIMPFMLLMVYPTLRALFKNPLTLLTRGAAMSQILATNVILGAFYAVAILLGGSVILLF